MTATFWILWSSSAALIALLYSLSVHKGSAYDRQIARLLAAIFATLLAALGLSVALARAELLTRGGCWILASILLPAALGFAVEGSRALLARLARRTSRGHPR